MGANANNAVIYLVSTILNLYLCVVFLRIALSWVKADFYNPVSQLVWKATQPVVAPFQNVVPRYKQLDVVAMILLGVLALVYIHLLAWLWGPGVGIISGVVLAFLKVVILVTQVYTVTLTFQAILSWFGPGVNNPSSNILWSMNEPLLRPIRRAIPSVSGLDLSPLIAIIALQFLAALLPLPNFFRAGILG